MNLLEDKNNLLWDIKNVVYCYTNKINNKKYIGQTTQTLKERHRKHMHPSNKHDYTVHFHRAIRKYGIENFKLEIIHFGKSLYELNYFEKFYIKYYNTLSKDNCGYNIATGGSNGNPYAGKTEEEMMEIRQKQSDSHIGKNKGKNNHNYGKHLSEETRQKISEAKKDKEPWNKGMKMDEEYKQKIKNSFNDDIKKYLSESKKGEKNPRLGCLIERWDKQGNLIDIKYQFEYVEMGFIKNSISSCCRWYECGEDLDKWHKIRKGNPCKSTGLNGEKFIFKYHKEV